MEMPRDAQRINTNLGQAELDAAPPFFGRQMDWSDVSELIELLHKETRNPNQCFSKGQLKRACEGLLVQNRMLQKRLMEVMAEEPVIKFTQDGRLHSQVPASEVLKVFQHIIPTLEQDAKAQAEAIPQGQSKPELKIVGGAVNDGS